MIDYADALMKSGCLISSERISGMNDNMFSAHSHEFYELYYLESGERYHFADENLYLVTPGQFIIFEPGCFHYSYGDENVPFSRLLIYFKKEAIPSFIDKAYLNDITGVYELDKADNSEFYALINDILDEQTRSLEFYKENMQNLLNQLLIMFIRHKHYKKEYEYNNPKIKEIVKYINLNYMKKITLSDLSTKFYISEWHLCREFKKYSNLTVTQYINYIRIIHAQSMLLNKDKSITEICYETGFASLTHFERIFKSIVGTSPTKYKLGK